MTVEELEAKIEEEKARWAEVEEQMKQQFNQSYGAFQGRVSVFQEQIDEIKKSAEEPGEEEEEVEASATLE